MKNTPADSQDNICVIRYSQEYYESLKELLSSVYDSCIDQDTLEKKYLGDTCFILLAIKDNSVLVGCSFVEKQVDYIRPSKKLYVTYVAVDKKYRKSGVGRMMFKTIEDECRKSGFSVIELTSADFREGAHMFYDAIGFHKKKTTVFIKEIS